VSVIFPATQPRLIVSLIVLASFASVQPFNRLGQCADFSSLLETSQQSSQSEIERLTSQLKSSDEEERRQATLMLAALETPAAIPALTSALNDTSERVRALAITGLARLGDPSLVAVIAARLAQDKKPFVRKAAAYALGKFGRAEGTAALIAALKDKDLEVRGAAAVALGEYRDASAIAPLSAALADKSEFVRAQAARALGTNGRAAAQSVPLLINLLTSDKDQNVKRHAATALGQIGERAALPALERAARSHDPYLSQAANEAIKMITANKG
jgi:HEAT repeat protein